MKLALNSLPRAGQAWRLIWILTACAILSLPPVAHAQPVQTITVTVAAVYDSGERLEVTFRGGERKNLRLKGVRIPLCTREEALAEIDELTGGRVVFLELSSTSPDQGTGDLVGYLWADDVMVNEHLIGWGLATYDNGGSRYERSLRDANDVARRNHLGLHGRPCPA